MLSDEQDLCMSGSFRVPCLSLPQSPCHTSQHSIAVMCQIERDVSVCVYSATKCEIYLRLAIFGVWCDFLFTIDVRSCSELCYCPKDEN